MKKVLMASAMLACMSGAAMAATVNDLVDFNGGDSTGGSVKTYTEAGFSFYDSRIVGGPCAETGADKCAALNPHEVTVLTYGDGETFDLTSVWFTLLGKSKDGSNALSIYDTLDPTHRYDFTQPDYAHNEDYIVGLDFFGVTSITFESAGTSNKGNARFDFVSAVPVPAGGLLLLAALGGLAGLRRRKTV